ncbi:MAG: oligosaccharide flippase family protein [Bilifractor sp.]
MNSGRTRAEYSLKNASVAMAAQVLAIFSGFLTRVVLTRVMSADYVGINGLFTNILGALTLSELGIDTALVYALYRPVAESDTEKQQALMQLYSRVYPAISGIVLGIGIAMYPLLRLLMRTMPDVDHLLLIYVLYLFNTVSTYVLAYRGMMFLATQENYLNNYFTSGFLVIQDVLQIIFLVRTRNYILFLLVQITCNLAKNAAVNWFAGKKYSFLRNRKHRAISSDEKHNLLKNTRAMLIHKVGLVIIGNTDNLCLTFFSGLLSVGQYANYYLIIGSIRQVADSTIKGITGSIGNLASVENNEKVNYVFKMSLFAVNWLYGVCALCLYELLGPFVCVSFGAKYVFADGITGILCLNFFLNGIRQATLTFRDALGLFWYDRYKTVVEAIINLITSVILANIIGTAGVFIGTTISIVSVSMWVEPLVLYKRYLKEPVLQYFQMLIRYLGVTALSVSVGIICCRIMSSWIQNLIVLIIFRLVICMIVSNLIYFMFLHKTEQFILLSKTVRAYLRKKFHWSRVTKNDN